MTIVQQQKDTEEAILFFVRLLFSGFVFILFSSLVILSFFLIKFLFNMY
jgi:hypothetical protein